MTDESTDLNAEVERLQLRLRSICDAAEMLWIVLANVSGGDWTQQSQEWQDAAARYRAKYFAAMNE